MVPLQSIFSVPVVWRDKNFVVKLNSEVSLKELGEELQHLTDVKADTMKLIIPLATSKMSKLFLPFSDEHSCLRLGDIGITEGKTLRMMGSSEYEVDHLHKNEKADPRIAGFDYEEKRMKQRSTRGPQPSLTLPQGPYIFCDFRTLVLPGVQLSPPPSEALRRMHQLAADPGIVAVMNKHRWRVGIMTEMAPEGYVGISSVCYLGFNKNHGEEISLRLRTDDLKGFRKYESIKNTLLHELAHMVFSEHDSNFYTLLRQLSEEASALDWTRSRSHTLADARFPRHDDVDDDFEPEISFPHKLGGETSHMHAPARAASVAAAYHRLADFSTAHQESFNGPVKKEDVAISDTEMSNFVPDLFATGRFDGGKLQEEPDPDDCMRGSEEPDPDDFESRNDAQSKLTKVHPDSEQDVTKLQDEPDPDDCVVDSHSMHIVNGTNSIRTSKEPDPDDLEARNNVIDGQSKPLEVHLELEQDMTEEPDPDDEELRRIQDPATDFCNRLTKAVEKLRGNLGPSVAVEVLQLLFKIMRNVVQNPNNKMYKRIRLANPTFQRTIGPYYKAVVEMLAIVGFSEDDITDESGNSVTYLVLKRDDPAMLWLAKSVMETYTS